MHSKILIIRIVYFPMLTTILLLPFGKKVNYRINKEINEYSLYENFKIMIRCWQKMTENDRETLEISLNSSKFIEQFGFQT